MLLAAAGASSASFHEYRKSRIRERLRIEKMKKEHDEKSRVDAKVRALRAEQEKVDRAALKRARSAEEESSCEGITRRGG